MTDGERPTATPDYVKAAAEWYATLNGDTVGEQEQAAFSAWINASPDHAREYALMGELCAAVDRNKLYLRAADTVVPLYPRPLRSKAVRTVPIRARSRWRMVVAIAGLIVLGAGAWAALHGGETIYTTGVGESRTLKLADASVLQLNTDSEVRVAYGFRLRKVMLVRGEGFFQVAKDPGRPFVVATATTQVRAVGTEFNVRNGAGGTVVTVVEGVVAVNPVEDDVPTQAWRAVLRAGEQMTVMPPADARQERAIPRPVVAVNAPQVTSWRSNRIDFADRALGDVIVEINRYNDEQLVIVDSRISGIKINGSFDPRKPELFAQTLEMIAPVVVRDAGDVIELRQVGNDVR